MAWSYWKRLFVAVGILMLASVHARAATIEVKRDPAYSFVMITVDGPLLFGDEKRFVSAALEPTEAVVVLSGPGGNLYAGTEIGKAIRLKGFNTLVMNGGECASSCAYAWLGGRVRYME